jgi:hypothetical protein
MAKSPLLRTWLKRLGRGFFFLRVLHERLSRLRHRRATCICASLTSNAPSRLRQIDSEVRHRRSEQ